jgi:hypothetical protein
MREQRGGATRGKFAQADDAAPRENRWRISRRVMGALADLPAVAGAIVWQSGGHSMLCFSIMRHHGRMLAGGTCLTAAIALGCTPSAQTPTDVNQPLPLPFAVSDYFAPTGAYGDAASPSSVTVSEFCDARAPAPSGPKGDCYVVSYTNPVIGFGGVYWQFPPNNWGTDRGRRVSPGATKVTFYARVEGALPLSVNFQVGGIGDMGGATYFDGVDDAVGVKLSNDWQAFSIPIKQTSYDWVLGGFGWGTSTQTPIVFSIDDVQWQ